MVISRIDGFDYSGDIDEKYYEDNIEHHRMFVNIYGRDAATSLNVDLTNFSRKYRAAISSHDTILAERLAKVIRAHVLIMEEVI